MSRDRNDTHNSSFADGQELQQSSCGGICADLDARTLESGYPVDDGGIDVYALLTT